MDKREERLQKYLRDGEAVLWRSRPERVELLDADNGSILIKRWTLTTLVTLALLGGCSSWLEVKPAAVALILLAAAYNILSPVAVCRAINRQLRYYITDQRLILSGRQGSFCFMNLDEIDEIRVVSGLTGGRSLAAGSVLFPECEKKLRWLALHPEEDPASLPESGRVLGMVLYEPKNVEGALKLLEGRVSIDYVNRFGPRRSRESAA